MRDQYKDEIDKVVTKAINRASNFYELINATTGIHPSELINSLQRMLDSALIDDDTYQFFIQSSSNPTPNKKQNEINTLPVPHIVDFDWRFSSQGKQYLLNYIENNLIDKSKINRIALIGSPTLFRHYCIHPVENIETYLIDFNATKHVNRLTLPSSAHVLDCNLNYDISTPLPIDEIEADIVVIDPPWYTEYYKKFFEITDVVGGNECTVIGVAPPILTRDSVLRERDEINSFIKIFGFDTIQYEPTCVEYNTPPFEKNVFHATGIFNYPSCWRKGDFLITKRETRSSHNTHNVLPEVTIRNGGWTEMSVNLVRFKIRQDITPKGHTFSINLNSLYNDDIYPSVSRRFSGHENINVWTSGNRVFYCDNISILTLILERIEEDDIIASLERDYDEHIPDAHKVQITNVQKTIRMIVKLELDEYGEWMQ